jgi:hypothetical protein
MRLLFFVFVTSLSSILSLNAQIGLATAYHFTHAPELVTTLDGQKTDFFRNGIALGLDYRLSLDSTRIEFIPELTYTKYQDVSVLDGESLLSKEALNLFVHFNFYLLDIMGDSQRPTLADPLSEQLKKGLHLQITLGQSYFFNNYESSGLMIKDGFNSFGIGAGIGFDMAISERLNITPSIRYRAHSVRADVIEDQYELGYSGYSRRTVQANLHQITAGLRLEYNFGR